MNRIGYPTVNNQNRNIRLSKNPYPGASCKEEREKLSERLSPPIQAQGPSVKGAFPESAKPAGDENGKNLVYGGLSLLTVGCAVAFAAPAGLAALPCLSLIGCAAAGVGCGLSLIGVFMGEASLESSQVDMGIADPGNPNSPFHPSNPSNPINLLMH